MLNSCKVLLLKLLERLFYLVIGWIIIIPLTYLIPKKRNLILFKASNNNVKYLYFYACQKSPDMEIYYLTRDKAMIKNFQQAGLPVLPYPSAACFFKMFQASALIMDNHISPLNYYIFYRARKIQLWHGIPLKQIGPSSIKGLKTMQEGWMKEIAQRIAFYPSYDLFLSTSNFYTERIFATTIKTKHFLNYGYPRNDLLFEPPTINSQLLTTDEEKNQVMHQFKNQGAKIILYAPTFRDTGGDPITDKAIDLQRLNEFAKQENLLFVFKFHPTTRAHSLINGFSNCLEYEKGKDIYPVMSLIDLMITDYSSIYLDYLLLKRPVVFFPYDYEKYCAKDRAIHVDYDWITPGPKSYHQQELEQEIKTFLIAKEDYYQERRKEILDIAFKYQDGKATERIWNAIKA